MSQNLLELTQQQLSLALLALHQNWEQPPEELKHLQPLEWCLLEDFLQQLQAIKKMGSFKDLIAMIPGIGQAMKDVDVDDKQFARIEAIILSMTPAEREETDRRIEASRQRRKQFEAERLGVADDARVGGLVEVAAPDGAREQEAQAQHRARAGDDAEEVYLSALLLLEV